MTSTGEKMKKIIFLTVILIAIFALAGCGRTAEKADTGAPKDVSPDKPFRVNELVEKVSAEKDAWKGKEVIVSGLITVRSSINVLLVNKKWDKEIVVCVLQTPPKENLGDTVEVKGKISELITQGEEKAVKLDPCVIKQQEK
jgi:hypothetical protein